MFDAVKPGGDFYEQKAPQVPLSEASGRYRGSRTVTSRRSASRRHKRSNRATQQTLLVLSLKIILVPVLLAGGYFGLKAMLTPFMGPSDKDVEEWSRKEVLMAPAVGPIALNSDSIIDKDVLQNRLDVWRKGDRCLRSAESLALHDADLDTAIVRLRQCLALVPDNQEAQEQLMRLYIRKDDFEQAIPVCVRLLDQDPRRWDLKLVLLNAFSKTEKLESELMLATDMLEEQPNSIEALTAAAYVQASTGHLQEAVNFYQRILDNKKDHVPALTNKAYIHKQRGEWSQALPHYLTLLKLDPTPDVYHSLAQCYSHLGESATAALYIGQAIALYGEPEVFSWLKEEDFDPVRKSIEFRTFADQSIWNKKMKEELGVQSHGDGLEKKSPVVRPLSAGG